MKSRDIFDREINDGDFVVYGIRSGNSGGQRFGIVEKSHIKYAQTEDRVAVINYNRYGNGFNYSHSKPSSDNMVVVPEGTFPKEIEDYLIDLYNVSKGMNNV